MMAGSHTSDFRLAIPIAHTSSMPGQAEFPRSVTRRGWPTNQAPPTPSIRLRRSSSLDSATMAHFAHPSTAAASSYRGQGFDLSSPWPRSNAPDTGVRFSIDEHRKSHDGGKTPLRRDYISRMSFGTIFAPRNQTGFKQPTLPSKAMVRGFFVVSIMLFLGTIAAVLFVETSDPWGLKDRLESTLESYGVQFVPTPCSNPFGELGRLRVDPYVPEVNKWMPYDSTCSTPDLMFQLRTTMDGDARAIPINQSPRPLRLPLPASKPVYQSGLGLPWLFGKTVLLLGDHVERSHNADFCLFAGGKFITIGTDHALSPLPFHNGIDEKLGFANDTNYAPSRPSVCYLEQYDFMMVSVFHYGFVNRIEAERENILWDDHFYPPVAVHDRIDGIAKPLLKNLNRTVDFVEFASGTWDLRHFSKLDELAKKSHLEPLSAARLAWYAQRMTDVYEYLEETFPGVPLGFRTLQQTPDYTHTPFGRVAELDRVSRKVITDLNASWRGRRSSNWAQDHDSPDSSAQGVLAKRGPPVESKRAQKKELFNNFLSRVNDRISGTSSSPQDDNDTVDAWASRTKPQVHVDEWGALMLGQRTKDDHLSTFALPGGYLWGDIILYILEKEFKKY